MKKKLTTILFTLCLIFMSCLNSDDNSERPSKTIVGVWSAHAPYESQGLYYLGFMCFNSNHSYHFFDIGYNIENPNIAHGIQWNKGTWSTNGDTLIVEETEWASYHSDTGLTSNWLNEIQFKERNKTNVVIYSVKNDSLHVETDNNQKNLTFRTTSVSEIKNICNQ